MAPVKFGVGQSVLRKEDDALIRGKGRYTDDYAPSSALHALVLRSPHAHAAFRIDASRARGLPGVAAILTADDVKDLGGLPCLFNLPDDPFTPPPYTILARDVVRHVGDAVAFVVADTVAHARDAIEAIEVEWTPQPAVASLRDAVKDGAPQVWPDHPGNVLYEAHLGDRAATEAAFAKAHAVAEISIVNPRIVTNYMETRAVVCEYRRRARSPDADARQPGQPPAARHPVPERVKIPVEKMRVICPDVGGGFGTKLFPYREYALAAVAARKLRKTVKWAADRADHFVGDAQGRDNVHTARMALAEDGRFLGMHVDLMGNMGAYLSTFGPYIPHGGAACCRALRHPGVSLPRPHGVHQHRAGGCYRGAGRPEAPMWWSASSMRRRASSHGAGRHPPQNFIPAARDAVQDRHR